jgi:hypothetical protein
VKWLTVEIFFLFWKGLRYFVLTSTAGYRGVLHGRIPFFYECSSGRSKSAGIDIVANLSIRSALVE